MKRGILTGRRDKIKTGFLIGLFAIGWALLFFLVTAGLRDLKAVNLVFGGLVSASLFMVLFFVRSGWREPAASFRRLLNDLAEDGERGTFAVFTVGLWLAFAFQIVKRYTAAPSGADTIFFLAAAPVIALAFAAWSGDKARWGRRLGLLAALAGGAMIVANWELPSSFAPFAIFPVEELWLLAAATGLAMFAAAGRRLVKRRDPIILLAAALWIVTPLDAVVWVLSGGLTSAAAVSSSGWLLAVIIGVFGLALPFLALLTATRRVPAALTLTGASIMPLLATALIVLERAFGYAYLPAPFGWLPVTAGAIVLVAGVTAAWLS